MVQHSVFPLLFLQPEDFSNIGIFSKEKWPFSTSPSTRKGGIIMDDYCFTTVVVDHGAFLFV